MFNVHNIKPQCKICHKKLDPRSLKRHMKSQHQSKKINKPTDCLICGMVLKPSELDEHNKTHANLSTQEKTLLKTPCKICGKVLQQESMKRHYACHHTSESS